MSSQRGHGTQERLRLVLSVWLRLFASICSSARYAVVPDYLTTNSPEGRPQRYPGACECEADVCCRADPEKGCTIHSGEVLHGL